MYRQTLWGLLCLSSTGHATVPDAFGVGADNMGMGGGGVAHVDDGAAALMNPAGLYRMRRPKISAGLIWGDLNLAPPPDIWWDTNRDGQLDARDAPLDISDNVQDILGLQFDIGRQIGDRFSVGFAAYLPLQRLFRLKTFDASMPTYIMYDNRPQRYVLAGGVGAMIVPGLQVGLGADIVPRVAFTVAMTADIGIVGDETADDLGQLVGDVVIDIHEINLDVVPGVAPVVGIQLDFGRWAPILEGLMFGASWRGEIGVPIDADLDIQANVRAEDIGSLDPFVLAGIIDANLSMFDHYVPMKVDLGFSYRFDPFITAYVDARWTDWRRLRLSIAELDNTNLTTPMFELDDAIRDGNAHATVLEDTWSVRLGADLRMPRIEFDSSFRYLQLTTRAGFGWEPTPLLAQGEDSSFLDANRWWLSGGLGVETFDPLNLFNGPIHLDMFFQYHQLVPSTLARSTSVPRAGYPVQADSINIDGHLIVLGAELGFAY